MNTRLFIIASLFMLVAIYSCSGQCPESVVIDHVRTPIHVDSSIAKYSGVDTLVFMKSDGEELVYVIQQRIYKEIFRLDEQEVACPENESIIVDIDLDSEETIYSYQTDNGLDLVIRYWPDNTAILDPYDQEELDRLDPVYRFGFRVGIPSQNTPVSRSGMAMWASQETIDFFDERLSVPFSIGDVSYENVSFWRRNVFGAPEIYYQDDYNIVGFTGRSGETWIRK